MHYLRIATLFDDLTLIDEAGRIGVEPARQGAPPLPSIRDRTAPKPVLFP